MKKIDLPLWSDTLFVFLSLWLILLCVFRYYRFALWLSILLCTLLSLLCAAGACFLLYRRRKKKFLVGRDKEEKEKLMLHLALSSEKSNKKLFAPVIAEGGMPEDKVFLLFTMQPLSADRVAEKIRLCENGEFQIYCNALSPEAKKLCDDFSITVTDGEAVYALLKEKNLLPDKYICGEAKKRTARERVKFSFRKKNSRSFFISGAGLLVLSLFSFFPVYYIVSGSLLLFAALAVRLFGYS
ncbi:MAG: hypothetical protein J6Z36_01530 [Clostridia bacterium]|nr:hypothetical protein [Clostridia bacterium]